MKVVVRSTTRFYICASFLACSLSVPGYYWRLESDRSTMINQIASFQCELSRFSLWFRIPNSWCEHEAVATAQEFFLRKNKLQGIHVVRPGRSPPQHTSKHDMGVTWSHSSHLASAKQTSRSTRRGGANLQKLHVSWWSASWKAAAYLHQ